MSLDPELLKKMMAQYISVARPFGMHFMERKISKGLPAVYPVMNLEIAPARFFMLCNWKMFPLDLTV